MSIMAKQQFDYNIKTKRFLVAINNELTINNIFTALINLG